MATPGVGMVAANTLTAKGVNSGLEQTYWHNSALYMESVQADPFFGAKGVMSKPVIGTTDMKPITMPDNIIVDITPPTVDGKGSRTVTVPFKRGLNGAGQEGTSTPVLGNEENYRLKYANFYANDWGHGVATDRYGIGYREQSPYDLYKSVREDIGIWLGEKRGQWIRQALLETRSSTIAAAPLSKAQPFNPNWYFMGQSDALQPSYDKDKTDWDDTLGVWLNSYGGATLVANVPNLLSLIDYARGKYIMPTTLPGLGTEGYIYLAPPAQVTRNLDPSTSTGWGKYWIDAAALGDLKKVIPGAVGLIRNYLLVVEDRRAPTLSNSGSGSSFTTTAGYMGPGRNDGRITTTGSGSYDIGYLLGKGAVGKYEPEFPHFEDQDDNYRKDRGKGYFGACGYQLVNYDIDTPTNASMQHEGSMVVPSIR